MSEIIYHHNPSLYSAYNVTFEPHRFYKYDRCVGQLDPNRNNMFTFFTPDEKQECCRKAAELTNMDPNIVCEQFTNCSKKKLRGPKTGKFTDCIPDVVEPYITMNSMCHPINPIVVSREDFRNINLKSKKWTTPKWKYEPDFQEQKQVENHQRRNFNLIPLVSYTSADFQFM